MRPIDADALYEDMLYEMCGTGYQSLALSVIRRAPTIVMPPSDSLTLLEQVKGMDRHLVLGSCPQDAKTIYGEPIFSGPLMICTQ